MSTDEVLYGTRVTVEYVDGTWEEFTTTLPLSEIEKQHRLALRQKPENLREYLYIDTVDGYALIRTESIDLLRGERCSLVDASKIRRRRKPAGRKRQAPKRTTTSAPAQAKEPKKKQA